jgi:hypothetical protein
VTPTNYGLTKVIHSVVCMYVNCRGIPETTTKLQLVKNRGVFDGKKCFRKATKMFKKTSNMYCALLGKNVT